MHFRLSIFIFFHRNHDVGYQLFRRIHNGGGFSSRERSTDFTWAGDAI